MCVTEYSLIINGPHKCKYWTSWNQTYHLIIYTPTFSRPPRTCSMAMLVCLQVGAYRWPFRGKSKATQRPKKCLATQQSPGKVWYSLLLNWHAREFPSLFPRHGVTFQYLMIKRFFLFIDGRVLQEVCSAEFFFTLSIIFLTVSSQLLGS